MSDTWSSLLSGVVGAIVGGAASLAGTVLVNRMQMATNARMRIYDELLPKFQQGVEEFMGAASDRQIRKVSPIGAKRADEALRALVRASAVAGGQERRYAAEIVPAWQYLQQTVPLAVRGLVEDAAASDSRAGIPRARQELDLAVISLSQYLQAKLG